MPVASNQLTDSKLICLQIVQ